MVFNSFSSFVAIALVAATLANAAPTSTLTSSSSASVTSTRWVPRPSGTGSMPWNSNITSIIGSTGSVYHSTSRTSTSTGGSGSAIASSSSSGSSSSSSLRITMATGIPIATGSSRLTTNSTSMVLSTSLSSQRTSTSGSGSSSTSGSITSSSSSSVPDFLGLGLITAEPTASYPYASDFAIPTTSLSASGTAAQTNAIILAGMLIDVSRDVKKVDNNNRQDFIIKFNKMKDLLTQFRLDLPHVNLNLPDDSTCGSKSLNLFDLFGCALNKVTSIIGKITGTAPIILADIEPIATILGEEAEEIKEKEEEEGENQSSASQSQSSRTSTFSSTSASSNSSTMSSTRTSSSSSSSSISGQYIIWPTAGANMAGISSSLSSQIGEDNFATISIESTSTIFVAQFPEASLLTQWQHDPSVVVEVDAETTITGDGDADDSSPNCASAPPVQASSNARRDVNARRFIHEERQDYEEHNETQSTDFSPINKRAGYIWSEPAVPELKFISQPRGTQVWNIGTYTYDTAAGQGISVYVMDTGANMGNIEISGMIGGVSWLLPKDKFWKKILGKTMTQTDEDGHGSCVASKVAGLNWGVAKRAHVVVVKMNYKQGFKESDILRSMELIIKDVEARQASEGLGKSVVNISLGGPDNNKRNIDAETKLLSRLLALDVVVVIASGNDKGKPGRSPQVDSYPALCRGTLTNLIVAGSVDVAGARTKYSQGGPMMDISAPGSVDSAVGFGYGVQCADAHSAGWVRKEGTSFAAPAVAGLAAYFMSINPRLRSVPGSPGLLPQKVKSYLTNTNLAWPRAGGDLAISNGLNSPRTSRMKQRELEERGDSGAPSCVAQSGSTEPSPPALPPVGNGGSSIIGGKSSSTAFGTGRTISSSAASTTSDTIPVSTTTGMLDGAPWLDPTSFCDFGSATYPTISQPASITNTDKLCAYTSLNPASAITPKTTSAIPTNIPGVGGVPGCAAVVWGPAHMDCPYGIDGWCNCGGTIVPPLAPTKSGFINCDIKTQPTAQNCPVNTAYSSSLSASSASAAAASSRYEATAKAHPNTVVSSFACPTNAVVGGPDGLGPGQSNQETLSDPKGRQQELWANFNTWGCDMPTNADNDDIANTLCGNIPPNTVLSLGIGNQPFYYNSSSHDANDKNCQKQFYNIAFTVKDKCSVELTKDYCMGMYNNVKQSCPLLNPKSGAAWEGGIVTDNCGVMSWTSGYDITEAIENANPFFDRTNSFWWDTNHLLCGPNGLKDPVYCPAPLAKPDRV